LNLNLASEQETDHLSFALRRSSRSWTWILSSDSQ